MPGDRIIAVGEQEKPDPVLSASDVQMYLEEAGAHGSVRYLIERPSNPVETRYYYSYLEDLRPAPVWTTANILVNLVGVVYLLVGLFVFFKQGGRAPFALHFTTLCLVAFVCHFYKPYGAYEDLDLAVYFLNNAALVLFAPIFLHFCALYPVRYRLSERRPWLVYLLYAPAVLLVALDALSLLPAVSQKFGALTSLFPSSFTATLWWSGVALMTVSLLAGAGILVYRFAKSESAIVRQQL